MPESNPYLRFEIKDTVASRYADVAIVVGLKLSGEPYALKDARTVRRREAKK